MPKIGPGNSTFFLISITREYTSYLCPMVSEAIRDVGLAYFSSTVASVKETSCRICYSDALADIANVALFSVCKQAPERQRVENKYYMAQLYDSELCVMSLLTHSLSLLFGRNCDNGVGSAAARRNSRPRAGGATPSTVNNNGWLAAAEEGQFEICAIFPDFSSVSRYSKQIQGISKNYPELPKLF